MDAALLHESSFEGWTSRRLRFIQTSVLVLFVITLFVSAALLFSVQPMVAKMLLPLLGGTPAVWNTCMVFFQAVLLAGYAYALIVSKRRFREQLILQMLFLLVACVSLPIGLSAFWVNSVPITNNPSWWVLLCLTAIVGLPFFILSSNGPLLQKWFATTGFKSAADPYFLYSASNAGSFVALLAYPVLLEPHFNLQLQSRIWTAGYALLLVLIALCGFALWRLKGRATPELSSVSALPDSSVGTIEDVPSARQRFRWIVLAFVPSSLMLGVTNYLSTDIASLPLLWVIPLALYLLTLVLAFARRQVIPVRTLALLLPGLTLLFLLLYLSQIAVEPSWMIAFNLIYFFVTALTCHSQLATERPSTKRLPEFYLWLSLGGVLGGVFNALLAPIVFKSVVEYPLMTLVACLLLPIRSAEPLTKKMRWFDYLKPTGILVLTLAMGLAVNKFATGTLTGLLMVIVIPMLLTYPSRNRPMRFVFCLAAVIVGSSIVSGNNTTLHVERNFFGVLRVTTDRNNTMHAIFHDSTIHGRQLTASEKRCDPLSYFHREGPLGHVFAAFRSSTAPRNVAVVGLGAGAVFAHALPNERWTYYEINPAVVDIARDPRFFTYVGDCAKVPFNVVLGDARLKLRDAVDASYGLIVMDAFSSDVVPVHLITQQALDLYLAKLAPNGVLIFHISNRNLDLRPVVADVAKSRNLNSILLEDQELSAIEGKDPSVWVVMTRDAEAGVALSRSTFASTLTGNGRNLWTDDFSNILSVFRWR